MVTLANDVGAEISCYNDHSCDNILISTDDSEHVHIDLNMYRYSQYILMYHYYLENINVTCGYDGERRYIRYPTNSLLDPLELLELARREYPSTTKLPCEDIKIDCTGNNTDFSRECTYEYNLDDDVSFADILKDENRPNCYWMDIEELYIPSCEGTCGYEFEYNRFNITFELHLELYFKEPDEEYDYIDHDNETMTRSFRVCDEYFGTYNATEDSLSSIDAVFYNVLELISGPGMTLHRVINPPQSALLADYECLNLEKNKIGISTELTVDSVSDSRAQVEDVFDPNGEFVTESEQLLSALFGIPVSFQVLMENSITNEGFTEEQLAGVIIGSIVEASILIILIVLVIRYFYRQQANGTYMK